jgi:hypothetical protein
MSKGIVISYTFDITYKVQRGYLDYGIAPLCGASGGVPKIVGKSRKYRLYRHIRTSKEVIKNRLRFLIFVNSFPH